MRWGLVLALALLLIAGCAGLTHVDPNVAEDASWRRLKRGRPLSARRRPDRSAPRVNVAPPPTRRPAPSAAKVPVIAVFDIESKGASIADATLDRMTQYLVARLTATRRYQIVPRDQLKSRLRRQKRASLSRCYDRACQIEIGRELAAQKTLAVTLLRLGSKCLLTAAVYDLRKATAERGASVKGACNEDGIVNSIEALIKRLIDAP